MAKEYTTEKIRNIALIGHQGTGKTTLNEELLYFMGAIPKPGKVSLKNTVSDIDDDEKERQTSIHSSVSFGEYEGCKINIIDCPGMGDFAGQVLSALKAVEAAIVLVDAVDGIQMETEKMWRYAKDNNKPRIIFINKVDKENSKFFNVLNAVSEKFKQPVVPIDIPLGEGANFKGVIDLIEMKAYIPEENSPKVKVSDIPADMMELSKEYRDKLIEIIAETDDEMTMKFLDGQELSAEEVKKGLSKGITEGRAILATCGSSEKGIGIGRLLELIVKELPAPDYNPVVEGFAPGKSGDKLKRKISSADPFSAFVFKTRVDQYSGRLNYIKVMSGKLTTESEMLNSNKNSWVKTQHIYVNMAGKLVETTALHAGDIGVFSKVDSLSNGNTICDGKNPIQYPDFKMPQPVYALAVKAAEKKDEDKMNELFTRAGEEDPTFHLKYNPETHQNVISGLGELQINIIIESMKKKHKIEVLTELPRIAYRETITKPAKAEYRHKKQSGGHGQFGEVWIELEPMRDGKGLKNMEFVNKIVGGSIPKQFIPAVEKGLFEGMEEGNLGKFPMADMRVILYDGKYHDVDSNELSFKLAARGALRAAVEKASPVLLEPIMEVEIFVDKDLMGNILSDVTSRRGRVLGMEMENGDETSSTEIIKAYIPQAETQRYIIDLRSMSGGKATFEMRFSHYEILTGRDAETVLQKRHKYLEEEGK